MDARTQDENPLLQDFETSPSFEKKWVPSSNVSPLKGGILLATIIVLYVAAGMATVPLMSQYIHSRIEKTYFNSTNVNNTDDVCNRNLNDSHTELLDKIQKETSAQILYYSFATSFPSMLVNILLGSYSDFLGRKILFLFPLVGGLSKSIMTSAIIKWNLNTDFFYIGYSLDGIGGSFTAFFLAIFSYTADITPPNEKRTLAIVAAEGCLGVAASVSQVVTGFLIQSLGYFWPSLMTVILVGISVIVVIFLLPETVQKPTEKTWSPIVHLKNVLGVFLFRGTVRRRLMFTLWLLIFFFALVSLLGRSTVETIYQLDLPFCWTPVKIGLFGALRITVVVLCSLIAIKLFQMCMRDETIAALGTIDAGISFVVEALAKTDWLMYIVPVVGAISFTSTPIARSVMSRMTPPSQQGAIFSALSTVESICNLVSNTLYNTVYQATVDNFKGAVFLMMAGFSVVNLALILLFMIIFKGDTIVYQVESPTASIQNTDDQQ